MQRTAVFFFLICNLRLQATYVLKDGSMSKYLCHPGIQYDVRSRRPQTEKI